MKQEIPYLQLDSFAIKFYSSYLEVNSYKEPKKKMNTAVMPDHILNILVLCNIATQKVYEQHHFRSSLSIRKNFECSND